MKTQKKCTAILARFLVLAILCASFPGRILAANSSWSPTLLVNTEAFSVIDDRDTTANIVLKFGGTLGKTLTYDRTRGIFQLNAGLSVVGAISGSSLTVDGNASVSGALLVKGAVTGKSTFSGANLTFMGATASYILGSLGIGKSGTPNTKLEVVGTISGSTIHASSQLRSSGSLVVEEDITTSALRDSSDPSLYYLDPGNVGTSLSVAGSIFTNSEIANTDGSSVRPSYNFYNGGGDYGTGMFSPSNGQIGFSTSSTQKALIDSSGLEVYATISGTTLNANTLLTGSTLQGFGLYDCQGTSNKLTYNATTKKFLCEADQTGGGAFNWSNTGSLQTAFDSRYVNQSGDTMTGALTINLSSGFLGLKVMQTASGKIFHAEQSLTSSGTLRVEGAASFDDALTFGDALSDLITVNAASWTFANDTNFALSGGVNGLSFDTTTFSVDALNDRIGIGTTTPDTTLEVVGTISGSTIHASSQLRSSGSLVVEGEITGTILRDSSNPSTYYIDPSGNSQVSGQIVLSGVGNFDGSASNPSYNFYNGGGDNNTGMYSPAEDQIGFATGGGQRMRIDSNGLSVLDTLSGTTLNANTLLTGSTLQGFGLYDCQGTSNKLTYNATTKKFLCEADQTGGGAFNWSNTGSLQTAFDSRYVNQSGDTMTGALTINLSSGFLGLKVMQTASGKIFHAEQSLTSSGTLRVEGAASFDDALTFGDALSDLITVNAASWTFANDTNFALSGGVNGLSFDTTTFSVDALNDRIGIGTTTPETTLEVVGTVSGSSVWGYNLNNSQSATSGSILVSRQNRQPEWKTPVSSLVWYLDGGAVQAASQGATVTMPYGMSLTSVTLRSKVAPTGAAIIVDINENGTTLFSVRPQINAGATTGGSSAVFSDTSLAAGSDITVDIDQVGSTLTGSGITIMLNGTRHY